MLKTTAKDPADAVPVKITPERPLPMQKKGYNKNGKRGGGNNRNRRDGGNYRGNKSKGGYSKIITAKKMAVNVTMIKTRICNPFK